LGFDRTGFALFSKPLENLTFEMPKAVDASGRVAIDPGLLAMILEGIDLAVHAR
jgi:hypothetical protein